MSWYADALRVPLTGTNRQSPTPEQQPHSLIPPPNFTSGKMQSGNCCSQLLPLCYNTTNT
ncbi:unnamed protein product [Staurois parvus]|uniref:Uncharacterized protein n=1 Tax=Staurois parvus TaxID=386267 RepID=A0ABN9DH68_9NEOB|nr:unnamed protein product [Staurois parvus]